MKHPNASVAGGSTGAGVLLVYILSLLNIDVSPEAAAAIAGALATLALFIGRKGVKGLVGLLWTGTGSER